MITIKATAPVRWALYLMADNADCLRKSRIADRDKADARKFLIWVNAGLPVGVRKLGPDERLGPGDHVEFAECTWSQEPLAEYTFTRPARDKLYNPAGATEMGSSKGSQSVVTARGWSQVIGRCQS